MSAAIELEPPHLSLSRDASSPNASARLGLRATSTPLDVDALRRALLAPLSARFGHAVHEDRLTLLRPIPKGVADATAQLLLKSPAGQPLGVVLCSSPVQPQLIARAMERARAAKAALGAELGRHILDPLAEGEALGSSWAVLPFCRTLGQHGIVARVMGRLVAPNVIDWLRAVCRATVATPTPDEVELLHRRPLEVVVDEPAFPEALRRAAWEALGRLRFGTWQPRVQLMHQDLWDGNVLIDERPEALARSRPWADRFVVIDWPGSLLRGHPFLDLVRFADSTPVTRWELRQELARHAALLGCEPGDARGYVLAAAGRLATLDDHFPIAALVAMTERCLNLLDASGV